MDFKTVFLATFPMTSLLLVASSLYQPNSVDFKTVFLATFPMNTCCWLPVLFISQIQWILKQFSLQHFPWTSLLLVASSPYQPNWGILAFFESVGNVCGLKKYVRKSLRILVCLSWSTWIIIRASRFARVKGSVLCLCNKRLQNCLPFNKLKTHDELRGLLIASSNEK